jgi:hypothetical protein
LLELSVAQTQTYGCNKECFPATQGTVSEEGIYYQSEP